MSRQHRDEHEQNGGGDSPADAEARVRNPQQRPRVATIGLSDAELEAVRPLCGTLYEDRVPNLAEVDVLISTRSVDEPLPVHMVLYGDFAWHTIREPRPEDWRAAAEVILDRYKASDTGNYPHFLTNASEYAKMVNGFRRKGNDVRDEIREALDGKVSVIGRSSQTGHEIVTASLEPFTRGVDQLSKRASEDPASVLGIVSLGAGEAPLVWTSDASLAALYTPIASDSDRAKLTEVDSWRYIGLTIPSEADLRVWLWCFLHYVHGVDAAAVPKLPRALSAAAEWYVPEQIRLESERAKLLAEASELYMQWQDAGEEVERLGLEADAGVRAVLWSDGEDLVEAVSLVLGDLGFEVVRVDQTLQPGDRKKEDLQISGSDVEGTVIAEVKGYANDAKTSDLRQLREQREQFIQETGSAPSATWWIVNDHRREPDPSVRGQSVPNAGELLASHGVVAIPTRALFRLWRSARMDEIELTEARRLLRSAEPGVFDYPPSHCAN